METYIQINSLVQARDVINAIIKFLADKFDMTPEQIAEIIKQYLQD